MRNMQRQLVGALFATLGLMLWADVAPAAIPVGTVVAVSGSCSAGGRALIPCEAVQVSDTINVPAGGKLRLRMADGSVISVAPGRNMTVASYNVGAAGRDVRAVFGLV